MVYAFIAMLFVFLYGAKIADNNKFHEDYLGKDSTTAINGIFVIFVFMAHVGNYIKMAPVDQTWLQFKYFLSQLIVVTFLFYSGYGMMCSFLRKGQPYIKGIFKNRFLSLLLHFDLAIVLFLITNWIIGNHVTLKAFLIALTTWKGIGNSNWYITAILCLYILMIISFLIFGKLTKRKVPALLTMSALTVVLMYVFVKLDRPAYCYNTLPLFPMGMWYAAFKDKIDKIVMKNNMSYLIFLFLSVLMFAVGQKHRSHGLHMYEFWACGFMLIILLLSMKIKLSNGIINTMGKHVFSVYILQRIPMMIFSELGLNKNNLIFFALTFVATLIIAFTFDKIMAKIDAVLFKPKKLKATKAA